MKRRKFIVAGATSFLGAPLVANAANRLYGTPKSAADYVESEFSDLLKLSLGKSDMPVDTWETISGLQKLYTDGLNNPAVLAGLAFQDPALLESYRLSPALVDGQSSEIKMLRAILDPSVQ